MHPHLPQGIRVEEGTNQKKAIQGVESRPTAFLGACERGPLNSPTLVHSLGEFLQVFGGSGSDHPLPHAIQLFFANGGQNALVVRVANNARPAHIDLPGEDGPLRLKSLRKGAHEYLRAAVDYDGVDSVDADCFNLTLQRLAAPDTEHVVDQEIFSYVSIAADHPNFIAHALAGSQLMRVHDAPLSRPNATLNHSTGKAQYFQGLTQNGHPGDRITMAHILGSSGNRSGLFAFTEQYEFGQLYIPPLNFDTDVSVPVLRTAARMCDRRHAVLIADAPRAWDSVDSAVEGVGRFSLRGPNIALYYPWLVPAAIKGIGVNGTGTNGIGVNKTGMNKTGVNGAGGSTPRHLPPGGAVAGALERSALSDGPSSTPAGQRMILRGFRSFAEAVNERDSYRLASHGVNSLRYAKGGRKVIWDAVLLNNDDGRGDAYTSLRVRRLMQYVARSVECGLRWVVFEQHSDHLWRKVDAQVSGFLEDCLRRGWLAGATPDSAFRVTCDLNTNPGVLRQQGQLGLTIELAPLLPARFVKLALLVPTAGNAHYG